MQGEVIEDRVAGLAFMGKSGRRQVPDPSFARKESYRGKYPAGIQWETRLSTLEWARCTGAAARTKPRSQMALTTGCLHFNGDEKPCRSEALDQVTQQPPESCLDPGLRERTIDQRLPRTAPQRQTRPLDPGWPGPCHRGS